MMLDEALQAIGPVPVALGVLLLLVAAACMHRIAAPKNVAMGKVGLDLEILQLPQSIPSNIPYIGHVLGYVRGGHSYFSSLW
jgi:hypothetical protein